MIEVRIGKKAPPALSLDVEFQAPAGITVLYGPPGAGKSTVLEVLAGFVRPNSGRILVDDVLVFDATARVHIPARRRNCGYLFPEDALFPHMTLQQNVAFGAQGPRLERHRRIAEMLESFTLSEAATRPPAELTQEQRIRGALARALLAEPKFLLLDNPGMPAALFRDLRSRFAGPIIVATRDLQTACSAADQMLVMESGRILQRGTPGEVLDQPESAAVARLLGVPNVFECTISGLDPSRNSSRLDTENFSMTGPYVPGHFRGDRISVAIHPARVRVWNGEGVPAADALRVQLLRSFQHASYVRLEFSSGVFADLSPEEYERRKHNREWRVEFPPEALRIL